MYNLLTGRATWVAQLPVSLLAADARSARLALGVHAASLVYLDATGAVSNGLGLGLLHGLGVQAAEFYEALGMLGQVLLDRGGHAACLQLGV